jgi:hypothetical protein
MDDVSYRALSAHLRSETIQEQAATEVVTVTAGHAPADIVGETNLCLQAAVDYVAGLGGGVVEVRPGRYVMHDSLHLRPRVTVRGAGEKTVLVKAPMVSSPLSAYLGVGHCDVSVAEPEKFRPGMGVHIQDDHSGGFYTTCASIIYKAGDRLGLTRALDHDFHPRANGVVRSVFPVVSGYGAERARVEDLTIDGQAEANGYLNGCRGGGVFLLHSDEAVVRRVVVRNYNGDGISFQQCVGVVLEDCRAEGNRGHGFHPGSGSVDTTMRRLSARGNGRDGLYYCLRVGHGTLEDSEFVENGRHGISIGGRDTDHLIRRCGVRQNGGCGVYFRPSDAAMAPSRNTVEDCTVEANGRCAGEPAERLKEAGLADVPLVEVSVVSAVEGVVIRGNRIGPANVAPPGANQSHPGAGVPHSGWAGILIGSEVRTITVERNEVGGPPDRRLVDRRKNG